MKYFFIFLIYIYQKTLSPERGFIPYIFGLRRKTCMFYPSCSEYGKECFKKHGTIAGIYLTSTRILRCNPFSQPGVDLVPDKKPKLLFGRKVR